MPVFQCANCGCAENSRFGNYNQVTFTELYDWTGKEHLKGKLLCSCCAPAKFANGKPNGFGQWHNSFKRIFLPLGEFITIDGGNLQRREYEGKHYSEYAIFPTDFRLIFQIIHSSCTVDMTAGNNTSNAIGKIIPGKCDTGLTIAFLTPYGGITLKQSFDATIWIDSGEQVALEHYGLSLHTELQEEHAISVKDGYIFINDVIAVPSPF